MQLNQPTYCLKPNQPKVVSLVGAPTSQRAYHSQRLVRDYHYQLISVGKIIKEQVQKQFDLISKTQLGQKFVGFYKSGKLIPPALVSKIIYSQMQQKKSQKYLIQGFPKTILQYQYMAAQFKITPEIIYLQLSKEQIINNLNTKVQQHSITEEQSNEKIQNYQTNILPLILYLKRWGNIKIINQKQDQKVYKEICQKLLPRVCALYGPPCFGKTTAASLAAKFMGWKHICLQQFNKQQGQCDSITKMNNLMRYLSDCNDPNILLDDLPCSQVLGLFLTLPQLKVYYFQSSKDVFEQNLIKYVPCSQKKKKIRKHFQQYVKTKNKNLKLLGNKLHKIQQSPIQTRYKHLLNKIQPKIFIGYVNQCQQQAYQYLDKLQQKGYIHLNLEDMCYSQKNLRTQLGDRINNFINSGQKIPDQLQIQVIKKCIFRSGQNNKFTLSVFPCSLSQIQIFQMELGKPDYFLYFQLNQNNKGSSYCHKETSFLKYFKQGNFIVIDSFNLKYFQEAITPPNQYAFMMGPSCSGKSTLAPLLAQAQNFTFIQWEAFKNTVKEKLSTPQQPLEQLPFQRLVQYSAQMIKKTDKIILFDGWPFQQKQFQLWLKQVGLPLHVLDLGVSQENLIKRWKKVNGMQQGGQLQEQEQIKINSLGQKNQILVNILKSMIKSSIRSNYFQIQANKSIDNCIKLLKSTLRKRIFIAHNCQCKHNQPAQQVYFMCRNISFKYGLGFVDIKDLIANQKDNKQLLERQFNMSMTGYNQNHPVNYSPQLIMTLINNYLQSLPLQPRDILLYNYPLQDSLNSVYPRLADQFQAIETLGDIRSVIGFYSDKPYFQLNDKKMELERPIVQKKEKVQNHGDEQPPAEQPPADDQDQQKKPKFDIYDYEWSQIGTKKMLGQWFCQQKKPQIRQMPNPGVISIYQMFKEQLAQLNSRKDLNIYTVIL